MSGYFIGSDHTHIDYHKNGSGRLFNDGCKNFDNKPIYVNIEFVVTEHVYEDDVYKGSWIGLTQETVDELRALPYFENLSILVGTFKRRYSHDHSLALSDGRILCTNLDSYRRECFWDISTHGDSSYSCRIQSQNAVQQWMTCGGIYNAVSGDKNLGTLTQATTAFAKNGSFVITGTSANFPDGLRYADRLVVGGYYLPIPTVTE